MSLQHREKNHALDGKELLEGNYGKWGVLNTHCFCNEIYLE